MHRSAVAALLATALASVASCSSKAETTARYVGSGCPQVTSVLRVHNSGPRMHNSIVPDTATGAVVCAYKTRGDTFVLAGQSSLTGTDAERLEALLNRLPALANGTYSCTTGKTESDWIVNFSLTQSAGTVAVVVRSSGCSYATNGQRGGSLASVAGPPIVALLLSRSHQS